ncbi:MAG: hypothetical protein AAF990_16685 [Bacteroidota bacterium]
MKESDDLISQYVQGKLRGVALERFERRLAEDDALAERVELLQKLHTAINDKRAFELEDKINHIGQRYFVEEEAKPALKPSFSETLLQQWKWIVFLLVLVLAYLFFLSQSGAPTNAQLYAQYFETYPLEDGKRGRPEADLYSAAVQEYQQGQYAKAAISFGQIVAADAENMPALFGQTQALLNKETVDWASVEKQLQQLSARDQHVYVQDAKWYLALVYLRQSKLEQAKSELQRIVDGGGPHAEKAVSLLRSVDNN